MSSSPQSPAPEAGTEAQRKALDEMSAQLVTKLHQMIREQEQRVQAFAAEYNTTLPGVSPTPITPEETNPAYKRPQPPPLVTRIPEENQSASVQWEEYPQSAEHTPEATEEEGKEQPQESIGAIPILFIIVAIFILLRSCS